MVLLGNCYKGRKTREIWSESRKSFEEIVEFITDFQPKGFLIYFGERNAGCSFDNVFDKSRESSSLCFGEIKQNLINENMKLF